jgi:hypothetical protein
MDASVFTEYETDLTTVLQSVADKLGGEAVTLRGGSLNPHSWTPFRPSNR